MIREKKENIKGISLISLIIATIVLIILANVTIYKANDNLKVEKLKRMYNDVENLSDKIESYYAQTGKIPASIEYTNTENIQAAGVISGAVDTGKFLIIDLSAIENLTLNYGEDYEKVKEDKENANSYTDLYIINEASHNIFYVKGITIGDDIYYTNYTSKSIDTASVDLKYVDNVKIPDGYTYVEGNKETGIIICNNSNNDETYTWIPVNKNIKQLPDDIVVDEDKESEFLDSVNRFKGYYVSDIGNVVYIGVSESWSPVYDKVGIYKDKNGDTAYIPEGFKVSNKPGETLIDEGLVVQAPDESEFVWIPVDNINDFHTIEGYYDGSLQDILSTCLEPYTEGYSTEVEEYNAMKQSVETYYGFYIGRYETGKVNDEVVVKKDVQVYEESIWGNNMINDATGGAVELAKNFATTKDYNSVTSTLCYGIQWDATMQFFDNNYINGTCDSSSYIVNSKDKGNYSGTLMNTGSNNVYSVKNIYDMAGNVSEWTMEISSDSYRIRRGGFYGNDSDIYPVSYRNSDDATSVSEAIGFRITLYLN